MKNPFFIIVTALLFFSSCKSKIETISDASCESCEDAIIRFYGEPASDGCGSHINSSCPRRTLYGIFDDLIAASELEYRRDR